MDSVSFAGRIFIAGDAVPARAILQGWRNTQAGYRPLDWLRTREQLRPGDIWLDLQSSDPAAALAWCQARDVAYLSLAVGDRISPPETGDGRTAILGVGPCPALSTAFARIAGRDFAYKTLRERADDSHRSELLKLIRAGQLGRLAPLVPIRSITLVAPPSPFRSDALPALWRLLEGGGEQVPLSIADDLGEPGELGLLLSGDDGNNWWTGCRPGRHGADSVTVAGILAGLVWLVRHPCHGTHLAEDLPYEDLLEVALPHLGEAVSRSF